MQETCTTLLRMFVFFNLKYVLYAVLYNYMIGTGLLSWPSSLNVFSVRVCNVNYELIVKLTFIQTKRLLNVNYYTSISRSQHKR